MIETQMLAYLEAHDKDALADWARQHMEWHVRIYTEVIKQGFKAYDAYPTIRDMEDLEGWAYFHLLEHEGIAHSLGLPDPPDLGDVDPDDKDSWESWLSIHANIHTDIRSVLNII